jgi:short chain dehydrogenase
MRDCTMVVTGAGDSIGAAAARSLSDLGAAVVVVGRSAAKTSAVAGKLRADRYVAGFAHLDQVRQLARQLTARYPRIDVLINNAGLIATGTRTITGDGNELTFPVSHLPPFLRTTLLHEPLTHSQARVITTASSASTSRQASVVLDDLEAQRSCRALGAYATGKLENVLFGPRTRPAPGTGRRRSCRRAPRHDPLSVRRSQHAGSATGEAMTSRTRRWLMAAALRRPRPATGVSWPTVQAAVAEHAAVVLGEPGPTAVTGIDETRFGSPKRARNGEGRWRLTGPWETGIVDLAGGQGLLGAGHRADQRRGHRAAERPRPGLPGCGAGGGPGPARAVCGSGAGRAAAREDRCRSLPPGQARQRRGHHGPPPGRPGCPRPLRPEERSRAGAPAPAAERQGELSQRSFAAMWNDITDAGPTGQLLAGWIAAELLRELLACARLLPAAPRSLPACSAFRTGAPRIDVPGITILAQTIERWPPELLVFLETKITNAGTEAPAG